MNKDTDHPFSFDIGHDKITIWLGDDEKPEVKYAVEDLIGDVEKISGISLSVVGTRPARNALVVETCPEAFGGAWENYEVVSLPDNILRIRGSDSRGTMFGLYAFIRDYLKVDPFYHWTGKEPERRERLAWDHVAIQAGTPSFKFRGWFINDEDLLTGWMNGGVRPIRHPIWNYMSRTLHPEVVRKIVETALRVGCNLLLPSSYTCILNEDEKILLDEVARRGLFLTMHHCETLGVSSFTFNNYWKQRGERKEFSYVNERAAMLTVWREAVARWKQYPNVIWQLGLRCGGDAHMRETGKTRTEKEQGELLSAAVADQHTILLEELGHEPEYMAITLWAEGSYLNQMGYLKLPEKMMLVFSDNCAGYKMQPDFYHTPRDSERGYGIYYHQGIIWGTHLTPCVSPERTRQVLAEAYERKTADYLLVNVANIREFSFGISATAEIAREVSEFSADEHLIRWIATYFRSHRAQIKALFERYFKAFCVHPERKTPMFMDSLIWTTGSYYLHKLEVMEFDHPLLLVNKDRSDPFHKSQLDMYPQIENHDRYREAMKVQNQKMAAIYKQGRRLMDELPESESGFLFDMLVYYAGVLTCTGQWLYKLGGVFKPASKGDYTSAKNGLEDSLSELRALFALMPTYCQGNFKHWYRNAKSVNYQETLARHVALIEQYKRLAGPDSIHLDRKQVKPCQ
jgi:hypothetical protein